MVVSGVQQVAVIGSDGTSTNTPFLVGGTRVGTISLSPDSLGGQMALDARSYTSYRFKRANLMFVSNYPSTDTNGMAVAFFPDPTIATYQSPTYESIQNQQDVIAFSRKQENVTVLDIGRTLGKNGKDKFHTELDTATAAGVRQSVQGVWYGFFQGNDSTNTTGGEVLLDFELELIDRTSDYGFTVEARDREMAAALFKAVKDVESKRFAEFFKDDKDVKAEKDLGEDKMAKWLAVRNALTRGRHRLERELGTFMRSPPTSGTNPLYAVTMVRDSLGNNIDAGPSGLLRTAIYATNNNDSGTFLPVGATDGAASTVAISTRVLGIAGGATTGPVALVSSAGSLQTFVATAMSSTSSNAGAISSDEDTVLIERSKGFRSAVKKSTAKT